MPTYHVQRSTEIDASPEKVFEAVADYGTWSTWSPWLCVEPDAAVTISDDASSVGSSYHWSGLLVGEGQLEHRQLIAGQLIDDEIRFIKPFHSVARVTFEIQPAGQGAHVTWHMRGSLPWFLFWMRGKLETFIAMDYDRGLKMLKEWIETGQVLSQTKVEGIESVGPLRVVGVRGHCRLADTGQAIEEAFQTVADKLGDRICGCLPMTVYHKFDLSAQTFDYTAGVALPDNGQSVPAGLDVWSIPSRRALRVSHTGSYQNLGNAWSSAHQYARYKKIKLSKEPGYEVYLNDPHQTQPAELRTDVILLVK